MTRLGRTLVEVDSGLQRSFNPFTPAEWQAIVSGSMGAGYIPQTTLNNKQEPIGQGFENLVTQAYATNPIVFACENVRVQLFSEARFIFQSMPKGVPGEYANSPRSYLRLLENPWPGGTTSMLLKDMLLDADLAGNAFVLREANGLRRLRPDWVTIIAGNPRSDATTWDLDTEVLGYGYQPDGPTGRKPKVFLLREQVAHFKSTHDPIRRFSGMPWLYPAIKEINSDAAATSFKSMFWENAATPNQAVKFDQSMTLAQAKDWVKLFHDEKEGAKNAFKTMFLGGGASLVPVGANLEQADLSKVQNGGEMRIAGAANVPGILINLAGAAGSALSPTTYQQARREFADLFARPAWRDACGALETITSVPDESRLWYDDRGISFLQEDMQDAATIQQTQAQSIRTLIDTGYTAKSVVDAVIAQDFSRLKHTGLFSVQLQAPGSTKMPAGEVPGETPVGAGTKPEDLPKGIESVKPVASGPAKPPLQNSTDVGVSGEVRCSGCARKLADIATAPYRFSCPRCKAVTATTA